MPVDRADSRRGYRGGGFEITLEQGPYRAKVSAEMDQIARHVLANPVIEEYRVEFVG